MSQTYKIVVTVPEDDADKLREAIGNAGGGKVGDYIHCSFSSKGIGRFLPQDGASPAIGAVGIPEEVNEERIEITCGADDLQAVIKATRETHPYEEPAIDIYPLEQG